MREVFLFLTVLFKDQKEGGRGRKTERGREEGRGKRERDKRGRARWREGEIKRKKEKRGTVKKKGRRGEKNNESQNPAVNKDAERDTGCWREREGAMESL